MTAQRRVLEVLGRSAGGIAVHVSSVIEALDGMHGLTIDVAGPADLPVAMPKPLMPVTIPDGPLRGHLRAIRTLRSVVISGRYDVVHAHGLRAGIDSGFATRSSRATILVTVHNVVLDEAGRARALIYGYAESLAVRLSTRAFAASDEIAQRLAKRVPEAAHKIEVLYVGAPHVEPQRSRADVRSSLGLRDHQRLVVTVARLAPQKALDVMLHALQRLPEDVTLVVVGDGPLELELRSLAAALGLESRVKLLGFRRDAIDFIAAADVFCLSSDWEAVALAAKEAVLVNTPVVATDVGGMGELFKDRVSARLAPKGDPDALATALSEVLESPEDRRLYAKRAREELDRRFSIDHTLARLKSAYLGDESDY